MKAAFVKGVALGGVVSLATLAATAAFAGTGVGKLFNLGESNRVNARSQLEGATPSAVLNVTNSDRSASASGISIDVPGSDPPLVVNSATKVKNLNADLLDGHDAGAFQGATSKTCPSGAAMSSIAANGTAACDSPVVLPVEITVGPGGVSDELRYPPSSLALRFECVNSVARVDFFDADAPTAPATLDLFYDVGMPSVSTVDLFTADPYSVETSTQLMGEFIYLDTSTVTTVNLSGFDDDGIGENHGCRFDGTVETARR